jgi:hypothetical protein
MITRRSMLPLFALPAIAACSTIPSLTPPSPAQIAQDAQILINGLSPAVTTILGIAGVPANLTQQIGADFADARSAAATLAQIVTGQAAPTNTVQTMVRAVNDIAALAVAPPLSTLIPPQYEVVIQAAVALLPAIEAAAGIAAAPKAIPITMTPAEARLRLAASAGGN